MTQRGTQATDLGVMVGKCSPDSRHPGNVGSSFFRYPNGDIRNLNNQTRKRKTWTREDNQLAVQYYFRSNPSPVGYRKIMIEILPECASFQTNQRLAEDVKTIIKKFWFSDFEILEINQKINNEQDNTTIPDTSRIIKHEQPNGKEPPTSENGNI